MGIHPFLALYQVIQDSISLYILYIIVQDWEQGRREPSGQNAAADCPTTSRSFSGVGVVTRCMVDGYFIRYAVERRLGCLSAPLWRLAHPPMVLQQAADWYHRYHPLFVLG